MELTKDSEDTEYMQDMEEDMEDNTEDTGLLDTEEYVYNDLIFSIHNPIFQR